MLLYYTAEFEVYMLSACTVCTSERFVYATHTRIAVSMYVHGYMYVMTIVRKPGNPADYKEVIEQLCKYCITYITLIF